MPDFKYELQVHYWMADHKKIPGSDGKQSLPMTSELLGKTINAKYSLVAVPIIPPPTK